ncbi:hypothetical protein [Streptomyces sp. NRRL S-118]|uniref:hypothetical protein n=1 Tax=Streptomyces sp. NRRL S-118 TaxID=1463881 RepID=UPI0004CAD23A|nr:hypothetical protein [Streptomyces sp. NRRL S-118]
MRAGEYVIDGRDGRVGEVRGRSGGAVRLRPPDGGREWECPAQLLRPATPGEVLRARVRQLNRQVRLGPWG